MYQRRTLHLFAGAGGGILADLLLGHRPVGAVDIDAYCQRVLLARQQDGSVPWFPIFGDIRAFDGRPWRGAVDIVAAGFPCQPWSVAGQRRGAADERNLWPDTLQVVRDVGPRYVFLENAPALLTDAYFGTILGGLAQAGYDAQWCVLGADDVGAPHRRKRLWLLAHARGQRWEAGRPGGEPPPSHTVEHAQPQCGGAFVADAALQPERKPADEAHPLTAGRPAWAQSRHGGPHVADPSRPGTPTAQQSECGDGVVESGATLADPNGRQCHQTPDALCPGRHAVEPGGDSMAHADHQYGDLGRCAPGAVCAERSSAPGLSGSAAGRGTIESDVGGGLDGLAQWLDRMRADAGWGATWEDGIPRIAPTIKGETTPRLVALGNGQVPLCAVRAWQALWRRSQEP